MPPLSARAFAPNEAQDALLLDDELTQFLQTLDERISRMKRVKEAMSPHGVDAFDGFEVREGAAISTVRELLKRTMRTQHHFKVEVRSLADDRGILRARVTEVDRDLTRLKQEFASLMEKAPPQTSIVRGAVLPTAWFPEWAVRRSGSARLPRDATFPAAVRAAPLDAKLAAHIDGALGGPRGRPSAAELHAAKLRHIEAMDAMVCK